MFNDLSLFELTSKNIGSVGIIFFAFVCAVPVVKQIFKIVKLRSGQSVSVSWISYLVCIQTVLLMYGLDINSTPIVINGIVSISVQIPLLIVLRKFKGFSKNESKQIILFAIIIVAFWFYPSKTLFVLVSLGTIISTALLTKELYQEKNTGALDIWLLCLYLVANIFWNIFGYSTMDWAIIGLSIPLFFIYVTTIALWFHYYRKTKTALL